MKKIEAIVRMYKLDEVLHSLYAIGLKGHSVSEARGYGRQKGHEEVYRGTRHMINYWSKWRIELVCADEMVELAVKAIMESAKTGDVGDGKIFVSNIEQAYRIRDGVSGEEAVKL